ncbi:ImmA/IrrE family metallo-endopeptidase [Salipaludibacillus sp. HK11]|uniref:ImmA/IrrE family metallo-endopeptidase n=1 Tax=Salipaludibacillus sp. HK11 TaxID=3394320 RepID=UPI0039FD0B02
MVKYTQTHLEAWIDNLYIELDIHTPSEMYEKKIADYLNIYLFKKPLPSNSYINGEYRTMTIDNRISVVKQREVFFHELAHIVRHVGWQFKEMPLRFKELQEWDSRHFYFYAAMPWAILRNINLESPNIVVELSEAFFVSESFVINKLHYIRRKAKEYDVSVASRSLEIDSATYRPHEWSSETKRVMEQLKQQTGQEVINYVGLLRRD